MGSFRAGTTAITQNVTEMTLSGLAFGFVPTVTVNVRHPEGDCEIIDAHVYGTPTMDGFKVLFSAPVTRGGYYLDYVAFGGGADPTPGEGDTLQVSYGDLLIEVAKFLGYDAGNLTAGQNAEIDRYIQSGLRNFYYPAVDAGGYAHEWSFLKLSGSVTTAAGVSSYTMPNGFGHVVGQLVYGDAQARETVPVVPYGDVAQRLAMDCGTRARPIMAAFTAIADVGTRGQKKKLYLYPTPDAVYTLNFAADADRGKIDATERTIPLGGAEFSELIIESCLAVAEQKANDEQGLHTAKFQQLMSCMIARDARNGAQAYGRIGDQEGFRW